MVTKFKRVVPGSTATTGGTLVNTGIPGGAFGTAGSSSTAGTTSAAGAFGSAGAGLAAGLPSGTASVPGLSNSDYVKNSFDTSGLPIYDQNGNAIKGVLTGSQILETVNTLAQNPNSNLDGLKTALSNLGIYGASKPSKTGWDTNDNFALARYLQKEDLARSGTAPVPIGSNLTADIGRLNGTTNPYAINTSGWSKSFDQPNIQASQKVINDMFDTYLGRGATQSEIDYYTGQYLKYAAANPTSSGVNTATYLPKPGSLTGLLKANTTDTSTANNLTEQAYIQNQIQQSGDYKAYQAAGQAFDMLQAKAKADTGTL